MVAPQTADSLLVGGERVAGRTAAARFDDLRDGSAMVFGAARHELVAERAAEVPELLAEVERATALGSWAAGFVSYEAASGLDPVLATRAPRPGEPFAALPLAWFGLFGPPEPAPPLTAHTGAGRGYTVSPWLPDTGYATYAHRVEQVRAAIAAGDTYQCNLTVRLRAQASGDLSGLYRDLSLAQRAAYCAALDTGRFAVLSASPELFFDWTGDRITARPMKGTAERGRWPEEDAARSGALLASAKERAENLMIVDLLRNDLGRLAEWGSVGVPSLFDLERYETVWQLTSTVTATPRPATGLVEVFRALFPCGSVTGAPKRRTMELIVTLEDGPRGVYCGAIGIVAPPGAPFRARFNVPIRTVVVDRETGDAVYGTGGGITWDSDPAAEHAELVAKAGILVRPAEEFLLLETMAFVPGSGVRNRDRHLARIAASARYFGFAVDEAGLAETLERETSLLSGPRRVRLTLRRSGESAVEVMPMPAAQTGPVHLAIDREPVRSSQPWLFHKTTRRAHYRDRAARHPGADDVVLVNERGEPTETTIANLAVRIGGRWWTPPIEVGCLPGVERARLVEQGALDERVLTLDELVGAAEVAVVSSLRGWRPAVVDDAERGPLARR
ncbi:MAG TPA: aminodeoxychorismate synthase component I [Acidimicrobiales bacterium]|nr:aminodeoxychorismate synthase component I [Acidimicrobiales bacterium]